MEMWNKPLHMDIIVLCLMMTSGGMTMPSELPRYSQLGFNGHEPLSDANNMTVSKYRGPLAQGTALTTTEFEYSVLGQDPKDQHWYRVGLTSKANKTAYRAQFATRKHPPFDDQLAHRHDKTIQDLLNWLDRSEDQHLWQVYRDILESPSQAAQSARNDNALGNDVSKKGCDRQDHLMLVGAEETTKTTSPNSIQDKHKTGDNYVYFVKGLKPSSESVVPR